MARTMAVPCRRDLACYRNDGHPGDCAYPTPETVPQPAMTDRTPTTADAEEGVVREGSLTPGGNRVGPKAWALIVSLSEYDDWMGAVLDVVDEARAPLDVDRLARALLAVEDHSAPIVATDYLAIAATYAALEEPTE